MRYYCLISIVSQNISWFVTLVLGVLCWTSGWEIGPDGWSHNELQGRPTLLCHQWIGKHQFSWLHTCIWLCWLLLDKHMLCYVKQMWVSQTPLCMNVWSVRPTTDTWFILVFTTTQTIKWVKMLNYIKFGWSIMYCSLWVAQHRCSLVLHQKHECNYRHIQLICFTGNFTLGWI